MKRKNKRKGERLERKRGMRRRRSNISERFVLQCGNGSSDYFPPREGFKKTKWKFLMEFSMKGA